MQIKFGTDGWRGIIADDFTVANVRYCAQSLADYLHAKGTASQGLVIGYDTRFASERFADAAAEVIAANGIKVSLCAKAVPTPLVSFGIVRQKAAGGIVITASHNPGEWNGFKLKSSDGASAPTEMEQDVEKRLPEIIRKDRVKRIELKEAVSNGLVSYLEIDAPYVQQMGELIDIERIRQAGIKIAVDSMFGAGMGYFKNILAGGKTEVVEIHGERNPSFPGLKQPEPIGRNLAELCAFVPKTGADIGLATDGDADRIGVVDEKGNPLTPLQIFALLALYLLEVRGERGAIVKTLTTTSMLNKLAAMYDVPLYETKVGFKYVAPLMLQHDAMIGGEESSGFGFRNHIPERDGILAGLYLLDLVARTGKKPSELIDYLYSKVGPHHYDRVDVEFPAGDREAIIRRLKSNLPARLGGVEVKKVNADDGFHFCLADGSWLLIRFSGTEPLLRIYAEAPSLGQAERIIAEGRAVLKI
ncbi:MAG: phosphoglucomutase/phosphomannomutase family protein [Dehalococcoidia bacterium]|nr:phosphoglucomutase/phosphomannomutase family protein [Dehalococcoidia bacterium]